MSELSLYLHIGFRENTKAGSDLNGCQLPEYWSSENNQLCFSMFIAITRKHWSSVCVKFKEVSRPTKVIFVGVSEKRHLLLTELYKNYAAFRPLLLWIVCIYVQYID